jgi:glycosyltransferase involved in cell wall biosynthesis
MRIGLNLLFLEPGRTGGMETYARELVPLLPEAMPEASFTVIAGRELASEWLASPWHEGVELSSLSVSSGTRIRRTAAEQLLVARAARRLKLDLLHSLSASSPVVSGCRSVITIHDVMFLTYPEAQTRAMALGLRLVVPPAARRASRLIAPSQSSADDITRCLGVEAARIDVIPEGPGRPPVPLGMSDEEIRARFALGEAPVVLSVSARRPHKNLRRLIEAMALVPGAVLVLPGYETVFDEELLGVARAAGVEERVRLVGWVTDEELEGLYRSARCMVFPSLSEGFGLPVLEAMGRGVPVAVSGETALAEVAGNAGLRLDPMSVGSIADSIQALLADPELRDSLVRQGLERAADFDWPRAAAATAESYRRALGQSRM